MCCASRSRLSMYSTWMFAFFFFNDTATTEIYTLSLHDLFRSRCGAGSYRRRAWHPLLGCGSRRSEEHTSELQSHVKLVCRLLLEKKKGRRSSRSSDTRPAPIS